MGSIYRGDCDLPQVFSHVWHVRASGGHTRVLASASEHGGSQADVGQGLAWIRCGGAVLVAPLEVEVT